MWRLSHPTHGFTEAYTEYDTVVLVRAGWTILTGDPVNVGLVELSELDPTITLSEPDSAGKAEISNVGGNLSISADKDAAQATTIITILVDGAEVARINTNGTFLIGATAAGASLTKGLILSTGTAPTGNITDGAQIYSADQAAGNACLHARSEAGNVVKLFTGAAVTAVPAAPSGGVVQDAEARTAIGGLRTTCSDLIARLQAAGLTA